MISSAMSQMFWVIKAQYDAAVEINLTSRLLDSRYIQEDQSRLLEI